MLKYLESRTSGKVRWRLLAGVLALILVASAGLLLGSRGVILPSSAGLERDLLLSLRLPRVMAAFTVGCGLGAAGLLAQAVTRNPLADPGLLGVASGALLGAVLVRTTWGLNGAQLAWPSILGALMATGVVLAAANRHRTSGSPLPLILVGMALNAVLGGLVAFITLSNPVAFTTLRYWLVGSLAGRSTEVTLLAVVLMIPALIAVPLLGRQLDVMALGPDRASSLGAQPRWILAMAAVLIAWLAGVATALAGPVAFVGLAAPHLTRAVMRSPNHLPLAVAVMATGAGLVTLADMVGRLAASPGEVSVSIVCAVIGAPVLIVVGLRGRLHRIQK